MPRFRSHRLAALTLGLALTSLAPAAAFQPAPHPTAPAAVSELWSWLHRLWAKEGCHIDPNGHCLP